MKRLVLVGLAAAAGLAPFTAVPPAQASHYCDNVLCKAANVVCHADDVLYNKSAAYRESGASIECLE